MQEFLTKTIIVILAIILIYVLSILTYETFFGPQVRMDERLQEYYRSNIQDKCGINDNDLMKRAFMKISNCLNKKDITIGQLDSIIHQK